MFWNSSSCIYPWRDSYVWSIFSYCLMLWVIFEPLLGWIANYTPQFLFVLLFNEDVLSNHRLKTISLNSSNINMKRKWRNSWIHFSLPPIFLRKKCIQKVVFWSKSVRNILYPSSWLLVIQIFIYKNAIKRFTIASKLHKSMAPLKL